MRNEETEKQTFDLIDFSFLKSVLSIIIKQKKTSPTTIRILSVGIWSVMPPRYASDDFNVIIHI